MAGVFFFATTLGSERRATVGWLDPEGTAELVPTHGPPKFDSILAPDGRGRILGEADRSVPAGPVHGHRPDVRRATTRPDGPIYGAEGVGPDGSPLRQGRVVGCARSSAGSNQAGRGCAGTWRWRQGLNFDPATSRFVADARGAVAAPTVYSEALSWWTVHWSTIEPKSRKRPSATCPPDPRARSPRRHGGLPAGIGHDSAQQSAQRKSPSSA